MADAADPLLCHKCRTLATRDRAGRLEPCQACGATYFLRASKFDGIPLDAEHTFLHRAGEAQPATRAPLARRLATLTPADRRFLKSMRIPTEGLDA